MSKNFLFFTKKFVAHGNTPEHLNIQAHIFPNLIKLPYLFSTFIISWGCPLAKVEGQQLLQNAN